LKESEGGTSIEDDASEPTTQSLIQ